MPKAPTEEIQKALEDVRDAARAVLALPTWSAELVNALRVLVTRAGKAAATVLLALPREELAKIGAKEKSRALARKRARPSATPRRRDRRRR
ncbi:MAG: hypothetical protein ACJ79H_22435 [Myxococcales bacterium]